MPYLRENPTDTSDPGTVSGRQARADRMLQAIETLWQGPAMTVWQLLPQMWHLMPVLKSPGLSPMAPSKPMATIRLDTILCIESCGRWIGYPRG